MKRMNTWNRILALVLALVLLLGLVPTYEVRANAQQELTCAIDVLSGNGVLEGNTVTFRDVELDYVPANGTTRLDDGWWVGIKVIAPATLNMESAAYQRQTSTGWTDSTLFKNAKDSDDGAAEAYIELWGLINEQYLNDAKVQNKNVHYGYRFDWDGNGDYEDVLHMEVVPTATTLKKDGKVVYPVSAGYATVNAISGGMQINGNCSDVVTALHNQVTVLEWSAADADAGRLQDGWWLGVDVIAPANVDLSLVTYQNKGSDGWSAAKSFDKNKDTANSIQLWGLLNETYLANAVANNKKLNYQWRFDWNGDKVYEQLVMITIDPTLAVLHDADGNQVFPNFGNVIPLTGGTVAGENASLTVTVEETVLQWSAADPNLNRLTDGWWVGMLVNAPEGYTAQQLASATYKRRATSSVSETGWGEYQKVDVADVRDTDTRVQIWMPLTQELVNKYQKLGKNIATECVFDWNADGKDDQTITLEVVPSEKIVLKKVDQNPLSFVVPYPAPQWVGEPYQNTAIGGSGDGAITYSIVEGEEFASINTQDGTLTFTGIGTIKVRAVKAGTSVYKEAIAEYTISTIRQSQKGEFKFENSQSMITVEFSQGTFTNVASGGNGTGKITYHVLGSERIAVVDENTGEVTFKGAGQVSIEAKKEADELYDAINVTYILEITMSEQPQLKVEAPASIVYSEDAQNVIKVSGGSKDINPTFTLVEGKEFAEVDPKTGFITTKAGDGTIVVSVQKKGNDGYHPTEAQEVTIYIEKASQEPLVFENADPKITFNDNGNVFVNTVSGGTGEGKITYALAEDTDAAVIDAETGKLTIQAAGKVKVIATKAADSCYKKQTATYELTISKDVPEFVVEDLKLTFGVEEYQIVPQNILVGEGKYTYTIGSTNQINAGVTDDGLITFDVSVAVEGVVKINIHKAEDDQYEAVDKTVTVTVSFLETDAKPMVSGDKKNDSGWYTGDITISAPESFQIIYCDELNTKSWSDNVTFNTEGQDKVPYVHLKNEKGITGPIAVEGLPLDKSCPTDLEISYSTPAWERTLETLTFGYYNPTQAVVTLRAKDDVSGIAYFTYNYGEGKVTADQMTVKRDGTAEYSFTVDSDFRDKISFTAADVAGWESALQDNKLLVVDLTAPELTVSYEYTGKSREEENVIYTNDKLKVLLAMNESNFDLSLINVNDMPQVNRDGDSLLLDWKKDENGVWNADFEVENAGEHELKISYTDLSKNTPVSYEKKIVIDSTPPAIDVAYEGEKVCDGIYHLVKATVTVTEKNFKPEEIKLTVDAEDITGKAVNPLDMDYTAYASNSVNWDSQGDTHTLTLEFIEDAIYQVSISYTSMTGNAAKDYIGDKFIVDNTTPAKIKIEYSESVVDKIMNKLTFGFYNSKVTVKVTAVDMTSGVESIWLDYIAVGGQNNSNKPNYRLEKVAAVQDSSELNVFTATLDIDPDARGKVTAYVQDRAENRSLWADDQHILVLDTKVPQLDVSYVWDSEMNEYQGVYYTQSGVNVKFIIDEANFDLAMEMAEGEEENAAPVVTVNGEAQETTWEQIDGTDQWVGIQPLTEAGDYLVSISFIDRSGNQMQTYTQEIRIDDVPPEVEVTYDQNEAKNENCYKVDRMAGIVFTEHNFKPELIELDVTAKDITGADVNIHSKEYLEKIRDLANWTKDGDVWTLDINCMVFDIDAIYDVSLSYTDPAGNDPATHEAHFEIDKTAPSNIKIDYSESFIDKMLNGTLHKFYDAEQMTLEITAEDMTSGVEYFLVEYSANSGKNNSNKGTYTETLTAVPNDDQKNLFTAQMTIDAQARGTVKVTAVDRADNQAEMSDTCVLVVDTKIPHLLPVEYEFKSNQMNEHNGIYYTQGNTNITFTIDEANFDLSLMMADGEEQNAAPVVTVNGETWEMTWVQIEDTDQWVGMLPLSGNGDYVVSISYADRSGNEMDSYTQEIHIDDILPEINVTYDNNDAKNENCYNANRTGTLVITEHNFLPEWVTLNVTAVDITGAEVDISAQDYTAKAADPANWTQEGDVWTLDPQCLEFEKDAIYTLSVSCRDLAENDSDTWFEEFVVDQSAPSKITIEYSQSVAEKVLDIFGRVIGFGFYHAPVTVTVTAEDMTSGVDYIQVEYTKEEGTSSINLDSFITKPLEVEQNADKRNVFTATCKIDPQARGMISAHVYDRAGNDTHLDDDLSKVVVDNKAPGLTVEYQFDSNQMNERNGIYYTQRNTTVTFIIDEANFDLSLADGSAPVVKIKNILNGNEEEVEVQWAKSEGSDLWIGSIRLTEAGDYLVSMSYADMSTNHMTDYTQQIHIDHTDPEINVSYDENDVKNGKYYATDRIATIQITEHNFNPEDVILTVNATNIKGDKVDISAKEYSAKAKDSANWTQDGDVWTLDPKCMNFNVDARYDVLLSYTDLAENGPVVYTEEFVIDKVEPANIKISYSQSVTEKINGIYNDKMTVEVRVTDMTAGVHYVDITYNKEQNSSTENQESFTQRVTLNEGLSTGEYVATCNIYPQARGTISAQVWDYAENNCISKEELTIVVDSEAPTRMVSYIPNKVLDEETFESKNIEDYQEGYKWVLYYKEPAVVTFEIEEANFDLSLMRDAAPVIKIKNILTDEVVDAKVNWTKIKDDENKPDTYIATYTIEDDGDYVVTMTYQDLSTNLMSAYQSSKIVIDRQIPVISTRYEDGKFYQVQDGVKFYPNNQHLVIEVEEHNFLADDFVLTVSAKDIQGNDVNVDKDSFLDFAQDRANWTLKEKNDEKKENVYVLDMSAMEFSTDAVYTVDIVYDDILDNKAEDYPTDHFVIDHEGPTNLQIWYSDALNTETVAPNEYGFYQEPLTVTVSADDITAGVDYFKWVYTVQKGASEDNLEAIEGCIKAADIDYSNKGMTATASFTIPAEQVQQLRGSISFTAYDRSDNSSSTSDPNRINVVDDIAPKVQVTYKPTEDTTKFQYVDADLNTVKEFTEAANAYYNGSVTATIVVDEANFFEGDMAADHVIHRMGIKVTRTDDNGDVTVTEYLSQGTQQWYPDAKAQVISWTHDGDMHTTQITLDAEGDYVFTIDYTDLCENQAVFKDCSDGVSAEKVYTSKPLTVDCTDPVVSVEYGNKNVIRTIGGRQYYAVAQSAVVTVVEHNFRAADFAASVVAEDLLGQSIATENFAATMSETKNWTTNGNTHTIVISYPVEANYTFDFELVDLAQNVAADYTADLFTVDMTPPKKLTVTYSTGILERVLNSITFGYYNERVKVTITAEDDVSGVYYFDYSYIKSAGVSSVNAQLLNAKLEEANNNISHNGKTATGSFMIPRDQLGNNNQFNGTVSFTAFDRSENNMELKDQKRLVVDNIKPTATVSYNAPVQTANNISYYQGNVNAQIKINEANFYNEDVVVKVDGQPVTVHWVDNSADMHTGTFSITKDGDHIVTITYKDRSNNEMANYTSNTLIIDTVAPVVEVSNIKNNSANKDEKYGFTITATDINMDAATFQPELTATVRNEDGTYSIKAVSLGERKTVEKGKIYSYTVEDLPEDAVYALKCTVRDMSGNEYSKVTLSDQVEYEQVRFSINRNGSTFAASKTTDDLVQQYYVYNVENDVVLEEINVDPVENYTVRLNGQELVEGQDYTTTVTNNEGEWSKRTYVISKDLFDEEGEYGVILETKDKADTTAFSDVKNLNVSFVVDRTAPVLTITGLQEGGRYQIDEQIVTVIPTDDGGRLYSMKVVVLDSDGQPLKDASGQDISVRFEMSGEEFLTYLNENNGEVTFTVPEVLQHQVVISCNDCAVNAEGVTNEHQSTFKKVTVSQSGWIIFYANKPLFYGTIGGVVLVLGLVILLIALKSKKKQAK